MARKYSIRATIRREDCFTFGAFMRWNRERVGISQLELARRSGVKQETLSAWECGVHEPRVSDLEICADVLGLSIDEYIGHTPRRAEG